MKLEEGKYYKTRDGRKVGPIVINPITGVALTSERDFDFWCVLAENGLANGDDGEPHENDIIAEWQDGPIREVTKKELVPGVYGRFKVDNVDASWNENNPDIAINFVTRVNKNKIIDCAINATELREAAELFNELADYLDDQAV